MSTVYICNLVPDEDVNRFKFIAQAAQLFNNNVIRTGAFDSVVKLVPLFIDEKLNVNDNSYLQIRVFKHQNFGKLINILLENFTLFRKVRHAEKIWFYNLTKHFLLTYILLSIFNKPLFVIVADFDPPRKRISILNLMLYFLQKAKGHIFLSDNIDFKKYSFNNYQITNGLVDFKRILKEKTNLSNNVNVLFSGAFNQYTGIKMALDVFKELKNYNLYISGRGEYQAAVEEFATIYDNITYVGFLTIRDYRKLLNSVDICISLRDPSLGGNQWNFPSKILEYLSYGKVVLSTMAYNNEINKYIEICNYKKGSIIKAIKNVDLSKSSGEKKIEFLQNNYSIKAFSKLIEQVEHE